MLRFRDAAYSSINYGQSDGEARSSRSAASASLPTTPFVDRERSAEVKAGSNSFSRKQGRAIRFLMPIVRPECSWRSLQDSQLDYEHSTNCLFNFYAFHCQICRGRKERNMMFLPANEKRVSAAMGVLN
jgi:hypothetical protein